MATIRIKLRTSAVTDRPGSIVYLITHRRTVRQVTTCYKLYPDEWDAVHSTITPTHAGTARSRAIANIKRMLQSDLERLHRIISHFEHQAADYSSADIIDRFRDTTRTDNLFCRYMESVILRLRQANHIGTANNYRAALNSLKRFCNNDDIWLESINCTMMEDYQSYLKQAGLAPNSISFHMRILRAVYNRAVNDNLTNDYKPFRNVFTGMEKTHKRAISLSDIRRIKNLDLSKNPNIEFARDIFMFLFYCRGMSFIDAAFLRKSDIKHGTLSYRRHKTGRLLHVKVVSQIRELIKRYSAANSSFLLPIITNPTTDTRKQYETALRRTNNALKTVAHMARLQIPLTTYVTRHAWATIAKSKNISVNVISDALGHDSISTTQIYLASIDASTIDRANDLILKSL